MVAISVILTTSKAYRRVDLSLPLPLVSRGRLSRVWPARLLLPAFLLLLSLPLFLPIIHPTSLTFNQMGYQQIWSLKLKLNCHSNIFLVKNSQLDALTSKLIPKQRGVWAPLTCLPNSISMESTTIQKKRQWQRVHRKS